MLQRPRPLSPFDWTSVADRLHNGSPEQFATKQDLSAYMRQQLDTLYLLDALEAEAILRRPAEERAVLLNRLSQTPRGTTGHTDDTFSTITVDEAATLSTVEDFTAQGLVVVSRYQWRGISTIGTAPANSYYTTPSSTPPTVPTPRHRGARRYYRPPSGLRPADLQGLRRGHGPLHLQPVQGSCGWGPVG
ncbi:ZmpA/ZmpB/ZmpC family metallo-endopeptidase [Rothia nasimurium]|nr:ZmpA/ZmpB/ZmpC family metallo-endopeptidase [Rothia nasimurium]MBF0809303.1 hypothetical protein [Rothia nasimurium]